MKELRNAVLAAHGGLERWRRFSQVRASIVSGGELWGIKGLMQDPAPRQMTVALHREWASVQPFGSADQRTDFSSDRIAIENLDGRVVRETPTAALLRERVLEILLDAPPAAPPPGFRLTPYGLQTDLGPRSAEAALALCREHRLAVRASRVRLRTLEDAVLDAEGDGAR